MAEPVRPLYLLKKAIVLLSSAPFSTLKPNFEK
jgi:hypothetical protein